MDHFTVGAIAFAVVIIAVALAIMVSEIQYRSHVERMHELGFVRRPVAAKEVCESTGEVNDVTVLTWVKGE